MLSACGFHLQGAVTAPAVMERTYVEAGDRYSLFARELKSGLRAAGVEVTDSVSRRDGGLYPLTHDETAQRVLSVSARNVPTEYEVFYTVTYSLDAGADSLLAVANADADPGLHVRLNAGTWARRSEEELLRDAIVRRSRARRYEADLCTLTDDAAGRRRTA